MLVRSPDLHTQVYLREHDHAAEEWLDSPGIDKRLAEQTFHDLRQMSALLGWTRRAVKEVARFVAECHLREFSDLYP